jgi:hypothetical protein
MGPTEERTRSRVARAYDIHPVALSNWKKKLKENGSKAFGGGDDGGGTHSSRIAFERGSNVNFEIYTIGPNGSGVKQVTDGSSNGAPAWSTSQ